MSDPDQPRNGRFQPGNKFGRGRQKGSENKFGPNLREKLLAGIAASGEKKAKRAGVNGKVDGTSYFIEALMENTAAASALLSKLIPAEVPPEKPSGPGVVINVHAAAEGQQYLPGNTVLMPFDAAGVAWKAYNGGVETWKTYLQEVEPQLTKAAFENLCAVVPLDRVKLLQSEAPLLRLVEPAPEIEARSPEEAQLLAELRNMTFDELLTLVRQRGLDDNADQMERELGALKPDCP